MSERGILDTRTVILLPRTADKRRGASWRTRDHCDHPRGTVRWSLVAGSDAERAAKQAHIQQAEADFDPIPFDAAAARAFGQVAADLRQVGRKPAARAYDALIAATAIANGLSLYTVNPLVGTFLAVGKNLVSAPCYQPLIRGYQLEVQGGCGRREKTVGWVEVRCFYRLERMYDGEGDGRLAYRRNT